MVDSLDSREALGIRLVLLVLSLTDRKEVWADILLGYEWGERERDAHEKEAIESWCDDEEQFRGLRQNTDTFTIQHFSRCLPIIIIIAGFLYRSRLRTHCLFLFIHNLFPLPFLCVPCLVTYSRTFSFLLKFGYVYTPFSVFNNCMQLAFFSWVYIIHDLGLWWTPPCPCCWLYLKKIDGDLSLSFDS